MAEEVRVIIEREDFMKALRKAGLIKTVPKKAVVFMFSFDNDARIVCDFMVLPQEG